MRRDELQPGNGSRVTLVSMLAMGAGIAPFYWIGVLGPQIVRDLAAPASLIGIGLTSISLVGLVCRRLAVRLAAFPSLTLPLSMVLLASAVSALIASAAGNVVLLLLSCVPAGLAIASANPITNVAIQSEGDQRLGLRIGVKQSGVQTAQFLIGASFPGLAVLIGWQGTLLATGVVLGLGGVAVLAVLRPSSGRGNHAAPVSRLSSPGTAASGPVRAAGPPVTVDGLVRFSLFMAMGQSALFAYLTAFALDVMHFSEHVSGYPVAAIGAISIPARIAVGWLSQGRTRSVLLATGLVSACSVTLLLAASPDRPAAIWFAVLAFSLSGGVWNSVAQLMVVQTSGSRASAGEMSSRLQSGFLIGLIVGPAGAALLIERFSYGVLWVAIAVCFAVASANMSRPPVGRHQG